MFRPASGVLDWLQSGNLVRGGFGQRRGSPNPWSSALSPKAVRVASLIFGERGFGVQPASGKSTSSDTAGKAVVDNADIAPPPQSGTNRGSRDVRRAKQDSQAGESPRTSSPIRLPEVKRDGHGRSRTSPWKPSRIRGCATVLGRFRRGGVAKSTRRGSGIHNWLRPVGVAKMYSFGRGPRPVRSRPRASWRSNDSPAASISGTSRQSDSLVGLRTRPTPRPPSMANANVHLFGLQVDILDAKSKQLSFANSGPG